jgi:hypothetical protein
MDENTIPVQTPSILQSEQTHFGVDSQREREREGYKIQLLQISIDSLLKFFRCFFGYSSKFSKVRITHQIL